MTNEFAIERLKLFAKHYDGENKEVFEKAIEALEKQIRIQEIMAMPIQENAVKYLAICGVMDK